MLGTSPWVKRRTGSNIYIYGLTIPRDSFRDHSIPFCKRNCWQKINRELNHLFAFLCVFSASRLRLSPDWFLSSKRS